MLIGCWDGVPSLQQSKINNRQSSIEGVSE